MEANKRFILQAFLTDSNFGCVVRIMSLLRGLTIRTLINMV